MLLLLLLLLLLELVLLKCLSCCSMIFEFLDVFSFRFMDSVWQCFDVSVCGGVLESLLRLRVRFDMRSPFPLKLCCCIKCKLDSPLMLCIFGIAGDANRGIGKFISWLFGWLDVAGDPNFGCFKQPTPPLSKWIFKMLKYFFSFGCFSNVQLEI